MAMARLDNNSKYYKKKRENIMSIHKSILKMFKVGSLQKAKTKKYIKKIPNNSFLKKAATHKYYKRIPHSNPTAKQKWLYFYTEKEYKTHKEEEKFKEKKVGILSGIMSFFGFKDKKEAKEKSREIYQKNQNKLKGVTFNIFTDYLNEYLVNKDKWDKKFQKKYIIKHDKKIGEIKKKTIKFKKDYIVSEKKKYNLALMKKIVGIFAEEKEKKNERVEQSELAPIGTGVSAKDAGRKELKFAREEFTRKSSQDFLSENLRKTLRSHQKDFVNLAIENFFDKKDKAIFNLDGTGAGKTLQELGLAQTYLKQKSDKPVLIITENKRIIDTAFMNDASLVDIDIFHVNSEKEIKKNNIYITTYNRLKDFQKKDFGLVIFDESHNLKNKSKKTEYGETIIEKADNIGLFSATPIDKGNQIGYIAKSFQLKKTPLMKALGYGLEKQHVGAGRYITTWKAQENPEEIANRIDALFTNLTKEGQAIKREVSLDNVDTKIIDIDLTNEQQQKFNIAYNNFLEEVNDNPKTTASGLMKLRNFVEELKIDATVNKILNDLKTNSKKQIVLFATRVNDSEIYDEESLGTLKEISKRLKEQGIEHVNVFANNKQAAKDIENFQNGDVRVILTTPQSGGTGLSLDDTTGDRPRKAIVMTPPFSAMDFIQMGGRINRLNTKSKAEIEMLGFWRL
jgi:superfamily II DNA or RNA helicase